MNEKTAQARFMDAIAVERQRLASRRGFLRGAAKVAGGGALAAAAMPATGGIRSLLAQEFTDDLEILNYALTLEHLQASFYTEGLTRFSEDDFDDDDDDQDDVNDDQDDVTDDDQGDDDQDDDDDVSIYARLEEVRNHEQAHVDTLTQTITDLGGTPVEAGQYDFGDAFDDPEAFLETAEALENTGVAAYLGILPEFQDPSLVALAGSIVTVEARHAGYLNDLNGESPFPTAFGESQSRDEVLEFMGQYIVSAGASVDATETATAEIPTEEPTETEESTETPTEEPVEPTETPTEEPEEPTETPTEEPTEEIEDDVEVPEPTSTP